MEDELIRTGAAALGGTGVAGGLGYLLISNWIKRAEEKFKAVHELTGDVSTLGIRVANLERDVANVRTDVRDGIKSVGDKVEKLDEKFDRFLERFFGSRRVEP
jgi:outer membrane murein-binding lipoprotein Lpp